jgi:hypothetical protein
MGATPNDEFSLDHLTPVQFEEFCFDLLDAMGATGLSWRKGSGFESSPSDQGRDIECYFRRKEPQSENCPLRVIGGNYTLSLIKSLHRLVRRCGPHR